jgi:uncharacterized membrane-anchored protein YjiN (DUF445 family)
MLGADPDVRNRWNGWWLNIAESSLPHVRALLGDWIESIIKSWETDDIAAKVELEIGTDLQFIRLNGAMVGGLVSLLLYAAVEIVAR